MLLTVSITTNNAYASAGCPENTEWDGNNCVNIESNEPIKISSKKNKDKPVQEIIITAPVQEIPRDIMIEKTIIESIGDGVDSLAEKMERDMVQPTYPTRNNYYFKDLKEWSEKKAELTLNNILGDKNIQNSGFGENNYQQIEYKERLTRSEDPVLQNQIIFETDLANEKFLKLWGNFTNY